MEPAICPPRPIRWYHAPYVIALGIVDWWQDVNAPTHEQVIAQTFETLHQRRHLLFRQVSSLILMLGLLVLITERVLAPWTAVAGTTVSGPQLLFAVALTALVAQLAFTYLGALWMYQRLASLYARGIKVLTRRAAAAALAA